jgi:Ca2+-binding RTX toxin-like protein
VQYGILKIWGTPGDDTIEVQGYDQSEANTVNGVPVTLVQDYYVYVNGVVTAIPGAGVTGIHVHAGAGNDFIDLAGPGNGVQGSFGEAPPKLITQPSQTLPTLPGLGELQLLIPVTVFGGRGDDFIYGSYSSTNALHGGPGNDSIEGGPGVINGGQGNDNIEGWANNTTIYGGPGADLINTDGQGNDSVVGGGGHDTVEGSNGVPPIMETNFSVLTGSSSSVLT